VFIGFYLAAALLPSIAQAQTPAVPVDRGQLILTVADPSGAVIVGASVSLVGIDEQTKKTEVRPASTTGRGAATFDSLVPGRYLVEASFGAFEVGKRDIQVRRGENRQTVTLPLRTVAEEMVVGQDPVEAAVDPRGGYYLSAEQIAELPADPRRLTQMLKDMSGGGLIFVDGFLSARAPALSQIKSIHIIEDPFAAENHSPVARVDIVTKITDGPKTGGFNYAGNTEAFYGFGGVRFEGGSGPSRPTVVTPNGAFDSTSHAVSPYATRVPNARDVWGGGNFSSSIVPGRSSFSVRYDHDLAYDEPFVNAALPGGIQADVVPYRGRYDYHSAGATFDVTLPGSHIGRVRYDFWDELTADGVGGYDLLARGRKYRYTDHALKVQENGPLGSHGYINNRFQFLSWKEEYRSDVEAGTVRVLDAFTSGGAQQAGNTSGPAFMIASDLDYVRGMHAVRTGYWLNTEHQTSDVVSNYLGTYAFESLDKYNAGQPRSFTRTFGDPRLTFRNTTFAAYVQDDLRLRKNLVLSPGIRFETQGRSSEADWGPRIGLNWALGKTAHTTIRLSWGRFLNWIDNETYERTVRFGEGGMQEINVMNPTYPVQPVGGPSDRYRMSSTIQLPRLSRTVLDVNQRISKYVRANAYYARNDGARLMRGQNLNAPINGVRPDASRANVIEVVSDASSLQHQANVGLTVNLAGVAPLRAGRAGGAGPAGGAGEGGGARKLVNWRRQEFGVGYSYNSPRTNTEGPFFVPPTGTLDTEWGAVILPNPNNIDIRHSASVRTTNNVLRNLTVNLVLSWSVGASYTSFTATDANGDLIFNDRPDGVGRTTLRGASRMQLNGNARYSLRRGVGPGQRPYTTEFYLRWTNLTNRVNQGGYSGMALSPFFRAPTEALNPRMVTLGLRVNF